MGTLSIRKISRRRDEALAEGVHPVAAALDCDRNDVHLASAGQVGAETLKLYGLAWGPPESRAGWWHLSKRVVAGGKRLEAG